MRIPIQQFTSDIISFFSQRIPETSDEYELLQTHHAGGHLDEHEHSSSVSSSQFEKTPARWLSYNHHLVKASPEKLRPASEAEEEFYSISGWLEGIWNAKKQFETIKIKGMIDLSQENDEQPPTERQDFWRREGKSEFMNFRDGNYFVLIMIFPSCLSTWTKCCHGESRS